MKKLLIFLMLVAGSVGAVDFPLKYGPNAAELDSFYVVVEIGGIPDTGAMWKSITRLDTTLSLTGEGLYTITTHYFYQGYSKWTDETFYYNTLLAGSGGTDYDTLFAYDTSGTDVLVERVYVTVKNTLGTILHQEFTSSGGYIIFPTKATDTILISGRKDEYVFDTDDTCIITGDKRDTLFGYDVYYAAATGKTCNVTVQVYGQDGSPAKNVDVSCVLMGSDVADSAGHAIRPDKSKRRTDASGNVTFTRLWSSYLIPATDYKVTVHSPGYGQSTTITVPWGASTYVVDFP